jgi:hypothetical protein
MSKKDELKLYSNPKKVKELAKEYFGDDVQVKVSTRKNKKYMIQDPNGKWIHFGQMGMEDHTKHGDKVRLANFRNRNWKWEEAPMWTPMWLSYHLLW